MELDFVKSVYDKRGRIFFCKYGDLSVNIVETKKGFSRGGHFHKFPSTHFLLKGNIDFKTFDLTLNRERICQFSAPCEISVDANIAHLLSAKTETVFIEFFNKEYSAIDFPLYRNLIEKQLN